MKMNRLVIVCTVIAYACLVTGDVIGGEELPWFDGQLPANNGSWDMDDYYYYGENGTSNETHLNEKNTRTSFHKNRISSTGEGEHTNDLLTDYAESDEEAAGEDEAPSNWIVLGGEDVTSDHSLTEPIDPYAESDYEDTSSPNVNDDDSTLNENDETYISAFDLNSTTTPSDLPECLEDIPKPKKKKTSTISRRKKTDFHQNHKKLGKKQKGKGSKTRKIPNWKQNCCIRGKRVGNTRRTYLAKNLFHECKERTKSLASRMSKSCKWIFWSCCEDKALRRYYVSHKSKKHQC